MPSVSRVGKTGPEVVLGVTEASLAKCAEAGLVTRGGAEEPVLREKTGESA